MVELRRNTVRTHRPILGTPCYGSELSEPWRFRSYFCFPPEAVTRIEIQGNTKGLVPGLAVYCDTIFLDMDHIDYVAPVVDQLKHLGLLFHKYTARRGGHIHLPIKPVAARDGILPFSIRSWIRGNLDDECVDFAPIHEVGQFRLAGVPHEKDPTFTKTYEYTHPGKLLELPLKRPWVSDPKQRGKATGEEAEYAACSLMTKPATEGNRYPTLFIITKFCQEAGYSFEESLRWAQEWNKEYCKPSHQSWYIESKMRSIWK